MDGKETDNSEDFNFGGNDNAEAVAPVAKKKIDKKIILFGAATVAIVIVAIGGVFSVMGGDDFSAPPQQEIQPLNLAGNAKSPSTLQDDLGAAPQAGVIPQQGATPQVAVEDPFADVVQISNPPVTTPQVATEISASEFDIMDEFSQAQPIVKSDLVVVVDEPFPELVATAPVQPAPVTTPKVDVGANLPVPDKQAITDNTRKVIKPDKQSSVTQGDVSGFCLKEDAVMRVLDSKLATLTASITALKSELTLVNAKLDNVAKQPLMAVSSVNSTPPPSSMMGTQVMRQEASESEVVGNKYFKVVGAMRGIAWLAVKDSDPVQLVEGDILKGFGLVEKISPEGLIWTEKGKVPTRIFR